MGVSSSQNNRYEKNRNKKSELKSKNEFNDNKMDEFNNRMLEEHNILRKKHKNTNILKLNIELCKIAADFLKEIIDEKNQVPFSKIYKNDILGENVLISEKKLEPEKVCYEWYKEKKNYNYKLNKFQRGLGHFTQLVWKGTKEVGFSFRNHENNFYYVALYYPKGNIMNEFDKNVLEEDIKTKKEDEI